MERSQETQVSLIAWHEIYEESFDFCPVQSIKDSLLILHISQREWNEFLLRFSELMLANQSLLT